MSDFPQRYNCYGVLLESTEPDSRAYYVKFEDWQALQAQLKAVQTEISDCRDAFAPDHPPFDLDEFMRELEAILE